MSGSLGVPAAPAEGPLPASTPPTTLAERRSRGKARKAFLDRASELLDTAMADPGFLAHIARHCVPTLADCASIDLVEGGEIRRVETAHVDPLQEAAVRELWERYPYRIDEPYGVPEVVRTGAVQWTPEVTPDAVAAFAKNEDHARLLQAYAPTSYLCVPLSAGGKVFGALSLVHIDPARGGSGRAFTASDVDFASALAVRIAGAIAFARLLDLERKERERAAFLSEASEALASTLDYRETLRNLARLAVPRLGDWCAVDMVDDPESGAWPPVVHRLALEHPDPERLRIAEDMQRRYPRDWSRPDGLALAFREGTPVFLPRIPHETLAAFAHDADHLTMLKQLGFGGAMIVPLLSQGRVLGAISLIRAAASPTYTEAEFQLAKEVARRASVAVDHARLYRQAQAANRTKMRFLATMSHELRTPLNAIAGYVELLEIGVRGPLNPEQSLDLARIRRSQRSLLALIDDVLTFAKLESGRMEFNAHVFPVAQVIRGLPASVEPLIRSAHVRFEVTPPEAGLTVWADPGRLEQILLNLVSNAVKFTERGTVAVRCSGDDQFTFIEVADTGIGIPEQRLKDIFEPFVQVDGTFTRRREGTGLGLAISREFARAMGGEVTVRSTLGEGTTMMLRLRRAAP
jgi:signal transduction histidine kinase